MVESIRFSNADSRLSDFLRARARAATDSRIALDVSVGTVAIIVAAALRPDWWPALAAAGSCFAAFGFWALLDRIRPDDADGRRSAPVLHWIKFIVAVIGLVSALALGLMLWGAMIGTWTL